jgi:EAL domain-containing protein (putative c-di-GMP-specific phosphodiesterase class I)
LEVTESVAMTGADHVREVLSRLKALGVTIAIDDFGTGFSSLSYLDRLPVDRLKIDKSFVSTINGNTEGARIAEMVVDLGRKLGLTVIAEGVETAPQAGLLQRVGCHEGQGYLYGRPLPAEGLLDWLRAFKAPN